MKNYTITVNGNVYDVTVEETGSTSGAATPRRTAAKPAAAPQPRQHQLLQQEPEALRLKQELPERYSRLRRKSAML
jgi:hypothetical protein